jgi:hypothetical protein
MSIARNVGILVNRYTSMVGTSVILILGTLHRLHDCVSISLM